MRHDDLPLESGVASPSLAGNSPRRNHAEGSRRKGRMEIVDQAVSGEETPRSKAERRLNMRVALAVAVLATFMGVTKVKDDNIVQAMLQLKSDAVDTWSEYQAKSTKQHLAQMTADQLTLQQALAGNLKPAAARLLATRIAFYRGEYARYDREKQELANKAKGLEANYDRLN